MCARNKRIAPAIWKRAIGNRSIVLAIASLATISLPAAAQNLQNFNAYPLGGITKFAILVEPMSPDAARCGITADQVETSVRFIIGQSKMELSSLNSDPLLPEIYVNVTALSNCAAFASLEVKTTVTILASKQLWTGATIWDAGVIRTGPNAGQSVADIVERLAKQLVNDWNTVNPH
jgi:anti-sigma-K factor RskA